DRVPGRALPRPAAAGGGQPATARLAPDRADLYGRRTARPLLLRRRTAELGRARQRAAAATAGRQEAAGQEAQAATAARVISAASAAGEWRSERFQAIFGQDHAPKSSRCEHDAIPFDRIVL